MKRLLIGLLWPVVATAQEVKPVITNDYLALIQNDSSGSKKISDSSNSMRNATMTYLGYNFSGQFIVKNIGITGKSITLRPITQNSIGISGSVSVSVERQHANRIPSLQKEYVQGRSINGALQWQGPETGELFSYGPNISALEFDGSNYEYDVNGRLVSAGNGNGRRAIAYDNSVFRPATLFSHSVTLNGKYKKNYSQLLGITLKAGQSREQTFIRTNNNKTDQFSASIEAAPRNVTISSSYNFRQERFTHNNRNGFLNRVYQNSLLTPASFSTRQGNTLGATQRSYSPQADNPFFLLDDEGHSFLQQQQTGNLSAEAKFYKVKIRLSQSFETLRQRSNEGYQAGTAYFPSGTEIHRVTRDNNYSLNANVTYNVFTDHPFRGQLIANYIFTNNESAIAYSPAHAFYHYQRSSHDAAISFTPEWNGNNIDAGIVLTDKIYTSNTSSSDAFFLPGISGFARLYSVFGIDYLSSRFFGSFNRFNNELPIDRSFATNSLVQYSAANSMQYLPVTEVNSFDDLDPVKHKEFTAGAELEYRNKLGLTASWFNRHTADDIFPVMNGGQMDLVNMADHRSRGIELQLNLYNSLWKLKKFSFSNSISFVSWRSKVTAVKAGYNNTAFAGFSDVHKALVEGEALGVIVGNTWLRDANNTIIIGTDGFPLVNNTPAIIGNPVPSFTMKMNHRLSYTSSWDLNINWEWKKGGDVWNGTQALLDYYGRSALTAAQRNTTNYVFEGVQVNGQHNTIPVSFYDPSQPVEQNRWVRYGHSGVAESYIQKGDCIRINTVAVSYRPTMKKILQQLSFTLYANNILVWSPYKGADPTQLLNDQSGSSGLDFFNLPSTRSYGLNVSLQF